MCEAAVTFSLRLNVSHNIHCKTVNLLRYLKMIFSHENTALGIFFRSLLSDSKPACQTVATLNVEQHSSEGLNTLTV